MRNRVTFEEVDSECLTTPGISTAITRKLIETWCVTQLQWVAYWTSNTPLLWEQVNPNIRGYLLALWATEVLRGATTKESIVVKCDHKTMTNADIHEGNLICQVSVAPRRPHDSLEVREDPPFHLD